MRLPTFLLWIATLAVHPLAPAFGAQGQTIRPAITGVAFFRDLTTSPSHAEGFYGKVLGLQRVPAPGGNMVFAVNRSQWVEVVAGDPPVRDRRLLAVGFTTRDVQGLARYLRGRGISPVEPMHDGAFAVHDPEGNLVYFVQSPYTSAAVDAGLAGIAKLVSRASPLPSATSRRMIHVGFLVRDRAREDAFWRGILGFRPYWHGWGRDPAAQGDDYVSMQVPDGTDWVEYMLNQPGADLRQAGVMNHFSLGTERMQTAMAQLQRNGCEGKTCTALQAGRDGKIQLNLYDPDLTRVEFMEFSNVLQPCCSGFTGPMPSEQESQ